MTWTRRFGLGVALLLNGTAVLAQSPTPPFPTQPVGTPVITQPIPSPQRPLTAEPAVLPRQPVPALPVLRVQEPMPPAVGTPPSTGATGQEPSRTEERAQEAGEAEAPKFGPTPPENVGTFKELFPNSGIKLFGWADMGYTYSSTGPGPLSVQPRENRFGNEFLVNQLAVVLEKPLEQKQELNFGFNATLYAGADAALLRPRGGFDTTDPRFGIDFRQLFASAHLPVLTEDGVDVKVGRMGTIIGYTSALAPYRPFYSNNYQWFYAQDGAFTGALANVHVSKQLDVINGVTLGANTFFTLRGDGPCYIGQVNYWLTEEKKTLLSASAYVGSHAIFAEGNFDSTFEVRMHHNFNKCFTVILQSDFGWSNDCPSLNFGTGSYRSFYAIGLYHINEKLDFNVQGEWLDDTQGILTGIRNHYEMAVAGFNYHPNKYVELRPEVRGDFANDRPAFGRNADQRSQLTLAVDLLLKF